MRASARLSTILALALVLAPGCGLILGAGDYQVGETTTEGTGTYATTGSSATTSSTGTGGSVAGVAVTPSATTLLAGATRTFSAAIDGAASTDVTWSVVEPEGGTISVTGVYRAPTMDGVYHVRATSNADATAYGDAEVTVRATVPPVTIASGDGLFAPTGFGMQSHLGYAVGAADWYLFYDGADGSLRTSHSQDFVAWAPGTPLDLPNGNSGDGRDLAVASTRVGELDIIHVTQGDSSFGRYHIRGTTFGGFEAVTMVNTGGDTAPDGCATAVLADGTVIDVTGWRATPSTPPLSPCGNGDVNVYVADDKEHGSSFMGVGFTPTVVWCVTNHVNAHAILGLGSTALILYEDGNDDSDPVNVLMTIRKPDGTWAPVQNPAGQATTPPSVFASSQSQGINDWTATVAGTTAHAVRHLGDKFEHRTFTLGGAWSDGAAIPDQAVKHNDGVFLGAYGDGLVLLGIADTPGDPIVYTTYDGLAWTPWATLVPSGGSRSFLSGYAPPIGAKPAIIWTEGGNITGALLP